MVSRISRAATAASSASVQSALAGAGILVGSYDLGAISVAFDPLEKQWHLSSAVVATLGTATLVGMLAGSLVAGLLADRFGRRRLLVADVALFVVASAAAALAPDFVVLAAARLATGAAIGVDFAVVFPFVAETVQKARRGRAMAWIMWAANVGTLAAYGTGAVCLQVSPTNGWRVALGVGGLLALPVFCLRGRLDESKAWGASRLPSLGSIARSTAKQARRARLPASAAATLLYQMGDQGLGLVLPLLLAGVLAASASSGAASAAAVKAVTIPAATLTVVAIERIGGRRLQIVGFAGRAVAFGLLGTLLVVLGRVDPFIVGVLLAAGYFFGAAGPDKTTVIIPAEAAPSDVRCSSQGVSQASGRLGGILGVTGYGILAGVGGPGAGLLLFAVAALIGAVISAQGLPGATPAAESA
jgi:MFS family permease